MITSNRSKYKYTYCTHIVCRTTITAILACCVPSYLCTSMFSIIKLYLLVLNGGQERGRREEEDEGKKGRGRRGGEEGEGKKGRGRRGREGGEREEEGGEERKGGREGRKW